MVVVNKLIILIKFTITKRITVEILLVKRIVAGLHHVTFLYKLKENLSFGFVLSIEQINLIINPVPKVRITTIKLTPLYDTASANSRSP